MGYTADGAQSPAAEDHAAGEQDRSAREQDRSAGKLVKLLSEQVSVLVRDELKLAQLEMTRKAKEAGSGAGLIGSGGMVALYGIGCLVACVVLALSGVVAAWAAALIVGAVLLAMAATMALLGKGRLQNATPPVPEQAVGSIKTDVEEIKERAHR